MFVCHGNICRSPMAEFIMKKLVAEAGLQDEFVIASSATSTEEIWNGIGNPVYPPAKAELKSTVFPVPEKQLCSLNGRIIQITIILLAWMLPIFGICSKFSSRIRTVKFTGS